MSQYLFNLTIGPVQSFIAQARKAQDLYAGSFMLSTLARKAFEFLENEVGREAIKLAFPRFYMPENENDPQQRQNVQSNPNRFCAIINGEYDNNKIKKIGEKIEKRLRDEFVNDSLSRMSFLDSEATKRARRQLNAHLAIYWIALPLDNRTYLDVYKESLAYLNGIKNYRPFTQLWEAGRKCNIDGERNVVVYRNTQADENAQKPLWRFQTADFMPYIESIVEEKSIPIWSIQPGEGLSAVSYAKRTFLQDPHEFPSTARICLMHDLHKAQAFDAWEQIEDKIIKPNGKNTHSEDHYLYEENINGNVFLKSGHFPEDPKKPRSVAKREAARKAADAAKDALEYYKDRRTQLKDANIDVRFDSKYFAIMLFDGDDMGTWFKGDFLVDRNKLLAFHQKLAGLLRDFGSEVRELLKNPFGKVIYAGGDDFLGFLNVPALLDMLPKIRKLFHEKVSRPLQLETQSFQLQEDPKTSAPYLFTFSAGIAIGHYKQPLGMVLDEARKAEKVAKDAGKNSFAISVIRHSGGTTRTVQPFGSDLEQQVTAMKTVRDQLFHKRFSNKFIHNIVRDTRSWGKDIAPEILQTEISRLMLRAKADSTSKDDIATMESALKALMRTNSKANFGEAEWENFTASLRICDFLYRNHSETSPTPKEPAHA